MNLLNHWKIDELRIAILQDLKNFIPDEYSFPEGDPCSISDDNLTVDNREFQLYVLIEKDSNKSPLKYSSRNIAALCVFRDITVYKLYSSSLHCFSKRSLFKLTIQKQYMHPNHKEYFEEYKNRINYMYDCLVSGSNALLQSLANWQNYLSEEEAKAFPIDCLKWANEINKSQHDNFYERFCFYPKKPYCSEPIISLYKPLTKNKLGRRDQQINVIKNVALEFGFDLHKIPDNGKAAIKNCCTKNYLSLFTSSGFDHAWQKGIKENEFKLLNYEKYSPKIR